jgi:hypothetical protein
MANPTTFNWADPTTNTDGTTITAGEISGYTIGIRPSTGTVGSYPTLVNVSGATAKNAALPVLASGTYDAAIQSVGPINSAWSAEITFTIAATPGPPTSFGVA